MTPYPQMRPVYPSVGRTYIRCPTCQAQIYALTTRTASGNQVQFGLAVALGRHKREKHSELKEDDDT